jgi:polyisoprenoid-binding protein YceI
MMRRVLCLAAAVCACVSVTAFTVEAFAAEYDLTGKNTTITFVGTKPNGKHEGGFKNVTGMASVPGDDLTKLKITLDIDVNSLYSDNPKLTAHLKSPDFFGVKSNPSAKFVSNKVERAGEEFKITGDLTMLGKTNSITVPARITMNNGALTVAARFKIDRTQWGMTYGKGKIDDDVSLTVNVKASN